VRTKKKLQAAQQPVEVAEVMEPAVKGEVVVKWNAQRFIGIEIWRGREWVRVIMQGPTITVSRIDLAKWDREYKPMPYPVGKAAWRLLQPQHGFSHDYTPKAKKILETIMAHYLVDLKMGKAVGPFADAAAAKRVAVEGKAVAVDTEQLQQDPDLAAIGKALAVKVDPQRKEECARAIQAILHSTENEMPEKAKKTSGGGRAKVELTEALKSKIKTFLNANKDLPYSKLMKAAAKEGFASAHVKIVKKEAGHRTKDTWAVAAGKVKKVKAKAEKKPAKAEKPKAEKPKAAAKKPTTKKAAAKKPAAKPAAKKEKKVTAKKPTESKPAAAPEQKPATPAPAAPAPAAPAETK
jgi:hypothetical protein